MQPQSARAGVMRMWRRRMSEDDDDEKEGNKYEIEKKRRGRTSPFFYYVFLLLWHSPVILKEMSRAHGVRRPQKKTRDPQKKRVVVL